MRIEIRDGGAGVACWNREAVQAFVDAAQERETGLAERNPDLELTEGAVRCYGCELQDYHYGIKCTAQLRHSLWAVTGEIGPRESDAGGSLAEISGLKLTKPGSQGTPGESSIPDADARREAEPVGTGYRASEPPDHPGRRSGLRGIFGRH